MNNCVICGDQGRGCFVCDEPMRPQLKVRRLGPPELPPMQQQAPVKERDDRWRVVNDWWGPAIIPIKPPEQPAPPKAEQPAVESWCEVAIRLGYKPGAFLGQGAYAKVYGVVGDPTKVIKVTCDKRDAAALEMARRHQANGGCQNIVRVFQVLKLPKQHNDVYNDTKYLVIAERLEPIPSKARGQLPAYAEQMNRYANGIQSVAKHGARGEIDVDPYYADRVNVWKLAALNIKGICEDLDAIGVTRFPDFHLANVMIRPGDRVVLSDLGCSSTPIPQFQEVA